MSFFLSKVLWFFVSPAALLLLLLAAGVLVGGRKGRALCGCVLFFMLALAFLPLGIWALTPLENRFPFDPPQHVAGIIVIGGDEFTDISEARGEPVALDSMRRYAKVAELTKRYPDAALVYAGGSGLLTPSKTMRDSEVAEKLMGLMGVPVERMIFERESRNTFENASFAAKIVHPAPSDSWLLVTSAWHMPRAIGCFRKAGWTVYPAPAGFVTTGDYSFRMRTFMRYEEQLRLLTIAAHEYAGLVSYRLMKRTDAVWPG